MRTIGIRASASVVVFAVLDTNDEEVVNIEEIRVPAAFNWPEALKFIRNAVLDILREFQVSRAGIRVMEPTAQGHHFERVHIEGVIQEAFASSDLDGYYVGQISSISARIEIPRENFKKYVSGEMDFDRVDGWAEMSPISREAVLCALGAAK